MIESYPLVSSWASKPFLLDNKALSINALSERTG